MNGQGDSNQRLSRIGTMWTMLRQAHGNESGVDEAQRILMDRYCNSVHRYLLGALRDEEAADELFQEFALRFLRGDFKNTDAKRGRFRDYVKTVLVNLVNDHHRARKKKPGALPQDVAAPKDSAADDATFVDSWRMELMDHAWEALERIQSSYHAVLLFHVQNPSVESAEMAEELTVKLGKPMTSTNCRVTLHRARERFAELLLSEVVRSLDNPTEEDLLGELKALNMLKVCKPALEKRAGRKEKSEHASAD